MRGENLERGQKAEYNPVVELKKLLHDHSNEVPEQELTNKQKDASPNMKVRKNWFESVFLAFGDLAEESKLSDELKMATREFMDKCGKRLKNELTTREDIEEADKLIKMVLDSQNK